jgi:NAD(P)-dependent dehydrogenase (short-subunit alcohol dehydrogenase family)
MIPNIKAHASSNYLRQLLDLHGHKKWNPSDIRAIIVGATKNNSIGQAIAKRLAASKICSRIWGTDFDVRDDQNLPSFQNRNVLILSHGVTYLDWFEDLPYEKMKAILDVNLYGTARTIQTFVKANIYANERKRIIIIGSMAHRCVLNGSAVYCASKAGVAMLGRCLAWELTPKGFDVFMIHPSNTEGTPMSEETIEGLMRYRFLARKEAEAYWNDSPIRSHILQTDEIAELVMDLLKPHTTYLSGCQIELAGGQR